MKVSNQWWMLLVERYEVLVHLNWLEIEVAVCGVFVCKKSLVIYKPSPSYIRAIIPFGYKHINNLHLSSFFSKSPEPIQTTLEYTLSRITTQDHKSNLIQHPNSFTTDLSHVPSETHCNQNLFRKPTWLQKYHQTQPQEYKETSDYNLQPSQTIPKPNQTKRKPEPERPKPFPKQHQPVFH